jgi:hypothetical protein
MLSSLACWTTTSTTKNLWRLTSFIVFLPESKGVLGDEK